MVLNKRVRIAILSLALVMQCVIWGHLVVTHWSIRNDIIVHVPVTLYDPNDPFRGAYLDLQTDVWESGDKNWKWAVFEVDYANTVTHIYYMETLPKDTELYVEDFELTRFYTSEKRAKEIEDSFRRQNVEMYIKMGIKQGQYSIIDLIIE